MRSLLLCGLVALGCQEGGSSSAREAESDSETPAEAGQIGGAEDGTSPDSAPLDATISEEEDLGADPIPDAARDVPDAFIVPEGAPGGAGCTMDEECRGGTCMTGPEWPGGYCTGGCRTCVEGVCSGFDGEFCAGSCADGSGCREGYVCVQGFDREFVCLPDPEAQRIERPDGEACAEDAQCGGGRCIGEWPSGYCTTLGCTDRNDCARGPDEAVDNRCLRNGGESYCVRICAVPQDCRPGYLCQPVQGGIGICVPNPNQPFLPPEELAEQPFEVQCTNANGTYTLPFTVAEDTTSYMVTPITTGGELMRVREIRLPEGRVDFGGDNRFQTAPSALFGGMNPTLVPAHSDFAGQLQSGEHSYRVDSEAAEMCWYLLEEESAGDTIDLNVYLVGPPGLNAGNAAENANLQAVLGRFEAIFEQAGVDIGETRYLGLDAEQTQRHSVVRGTEQIGELLELTERPGDSRDDALSINVVFAASFAFGQGTLGVSMGLPGPAALHGTRLSGVVFTAEFMGQRFNDGGGNSVDGNEYTGGVLAHEVGHYLGLFHTSEVQGRGFDPLDDTPQCRDNFPEGCPDLGNLMFPLARSQNAELTPKQLSVLRANPLTKE